MERLITLGRKTNQQTRKKMKYCQMDIGGWHTIISLSFKFVRKVIVVMVMAGKMICFL